MSGADIIPPFFTSIASIFSALDNAIIFPGISVLTFFIILFGIEVILFLLHYLRGDNDD